MVALSGRAFPVQPICTGPHRPTDHVITGTAALSQPNTSAATVTTSTTGTAVVAYATTGEVELE